MPTRPMSRFEVFIGVWNTTGDVLETESAPATALSATDVYEWFPGRHFVVHHVDARFGGVAARSMEVFGYDRERRKYSSTSYDDQGVSAVFDVQLQRRQLQILGSMVRFEGSFDVKQNVLTDLWELKAKNAGWQPWIELKLVRA
jgi:Protein of unknown function (DUF1579)